MLTYIILFLCTAAAFLFGQIAYFQNEKIAYRNRNIAFILLLGVCLFLATFRADYIGADHYNYVNIFYYVKNYGNIDYEQGYIALNRLILLFSDQVFVLNGIVALSLIAAYYYYIKYNVENRDWLFAALIFVLHPYLYIQSSYNAMRQCVAMAIVMVAAVCMNKKHNIIFLALVFFATFFHRSAAFMVLLLVVRKVNWNQMLHAIVLLASLAINLLPNGGILQYIANIFDYGGYMNYSASLLNNKFYVFFIALVIAVYILVYKKLYINAEEKKKADFYILSLSLLIIAVKNDMFYRIYIYLAFLAIPGITVVSKNAYRWLRPGGAVKYLHVAYYVCFFWGYILLLMIKADTQYVPFRYIWS